MTTPPLPPGPPSPTGPMPDPALLERYVKGDLDPATSVSVEMLLEQSSEARGRVNALIDPDRSAGNWEAIAAEIEAPQPGIVEAVLVRVGLGDDVVRVLLATPSLRRSWFIAMAIAILFGLGATDASRPEESLLLFLTLAPIIPVVGVALAYGPGVDPSYEITLVTPASGFRLLVTRAAAVLSVSLLATGLASLLVADVSPLAAAWIIPALTLTLVCLALMTWLPPRSAGAWVIGPWLVVVILLAQGGDRLSAFEPVSQIALACIGVAAAIVLVARRGRLETAGGGLS